MAGGFSRVLQLLLLAIILAFTVLTGSEWGLFQQASLEGKTSSVRKAKVEVRLDSRDAAAAKHVDVEPTGLKLRSREAAAASDDEAEPAGASGTQARHAGKSSLPDLLDPHFGQSFRDADSPVHKSLLALGVQVAMPSLKRSNYHVVYMNEHACQRRLFKAGYNSVLLDTSASPAFLERGKSSPEVYGSLYQLPFSDLAIEVLLVNATFALPNDAPDNVGAHVFNEMLRLLVPGGTFAYFPADATLPAYTQSSARAFLRTTKWPNVLQRIDGMADGVDVCSVCRLPNIFGISVPTPSAKHCQPKIQEAYVPLSDPRRQKHILSESSLAMGRIKWWPWENLLKTETKKTWVDTLASTESGRRWFFLNYVGGTQKDGSRGWTRKKEWRETFSEWIRAGRVKSILDAGAGSCTLETHLRSAGLFNKLRQFVSFGAYDCSQLRICSERGIVTMQWNWIRGLPFCQECRFDLVFQAEGLHHTPKMFRENTFDTFFSHVACGGHLFMSDGVGTSKAGDSWFEDAIAWTKKNGYAVETVRGSVVGMDEVLVRKECTEPSGTHS